MSNQTRKDKVKVTLFDIKSNIKYRQYIVGELSNRVDEKLKPEFIKILNQVIDDTSIFDREDLEGSFYEGEDDTLDLVLPAVAKVLHKIFLVIFVSLVFLWEFICTYTLVDGELLIAGCI